MGVSDLVQGLLEDVNVIMCISMRGPLDQTSRPDPTSVLMERITYCTILEIL